MNIANVTHDQMLAEARDHDFTIARFRPQLKALITLGLIENVEFVRGQKAQLLVTPSMKGVDFFMRCLGYIQYPLETFLLVMKHWNEDKNAGFFNETVRPW